MRGLQVTKYFLEHNIRLLQRIIIPEPDYPKALRLETSCSPGIAINLFGVLPAIQFHYQLLFEADEINDVRRNRMLAPELESTEIAVFQMQPKPQFRVG